MVQFFPRMRAPLSVNQAALVGCRKSQRFGSDGQARSGVMWKGQQHRKEDKSDSDGNCLAVNGIALADCLRICIAERRHRKLTDSPPGCNGAAALHLWPSVCALVIGRRASPPAYRCGPQPGDVQAADPATEGRHHGVHGRRLCGCGPAGLVKAALTNHMPFGTICQTSPR